MKKPSSTFWKLTLLHALFFIPADVLYANEPPLIVDEALEEKPQIVDPITNLPDVSPDTESLSSDSSNVINDIEIQGGTVFSLEEIAQWIQPVIGQPANRSVLLDVINKITTAYADAGYPLSYASIPSEQDLSTGKLTLRLVEGYLIRSEVEVESDHIKERIQRYVARMMEEKPLTSKTFERYTKLIEATPGHTFRINVPRPMSASGATTIRVEQVKKETFKAGIAIDDSEADSSRVLGTVTLNSLTSHADQLTVAGLLPNDEIDKFFSATYSQFINDDGLKVELSASHFKSNNDDTFFVADIPVDYLESKSRDEFSVGLSYPVLLQQKYSWWVGSRVHHLNEQSEFRLSSGNAVSQIDKDLSYSAFGLFSTLQFNTQKSVSQFKLAAKQGIDLGGNENQLLEGGATTDGSEELDFTYLTSELFWRLRFSSKWQIQTKLHGHWSDDILPSAEQARYGNILYARGYPEGQAQGDRGYAGELELRYIQPVNTKFIKQIEPYIVVDAAHTQLLSNDRRASLSSVTTGIALTDNDHYGLSMEYSVPTGDLPIDSDHRSGIFNIRIRWQL